MERNANVETVLSKVGWVGWVVTVIKEIVTVLVTIASGTQCYGQCIAQDFSVWEWSPAINVWEGVADPFLSTVAEIAWELGLVNH